MLPLAHQLRRWRQLSLLHHYHNHYNFRLLSTTSNEPEANETTEEERPLFGRLAARTPRSTKEREFDKEFNIPTRRLIKQYRDFKPLHNSTGTWRKEYEDFKGRRKAKESELSWGSGSQEDDEEDFEEYSVNRQEPARSYQEPYLDKHSDPKKSVNHQEPPREDQEQQLQEYSVPKRPVNHQEPARTDQEPQWKLSDLQHSSQLPELKRKDAKVVFNGRTAEEFTEEDEVFEDESLDAEEIQDEGDMREERYQNTKYERRHRTRFYANRMKRLCKERKLGEAIKILEEEMPGVGAKPDSFCYHILINACGRAGYTKKAFQLYNKMKERRLKVDPPAYTGLFMACAHSPWPTTDGLTRATQLRSYLKDRSFLFNQIVCHAMIKAFGWCGDIGTAFQVVDDMIQDGLTVTTETMNFLLQACVTNKDIGFRHAIKVWRKMRMLKLKPDIHSYNLLMRVVKDCGAGDPNLTSDLLKEEENTRKIGTKGKHKKSITGESLEIKQLDSENKPIKGAASEEISEVRLLKNSSALDTLSRSGQGALPNIIGRSLTTGDVVALGALDKPCDRLAIIGGPSGVLSQMRKDRVKPDLKTFTQMLESLPDDTHAEEALLESMRNLKAKPDTQFFNMLIRKRNFRYDLKAAKEVLTLMQDHHLVPDLITYGCVALGCRNNQSATQLLKDMDDSNFRPNLEIMSMLVKNSINQQDYLFTNAMLKEMQQRKVVPDDSLINTLEQTRANIHKTLLDETDTSKEEKKSTHAKMFLLAYKEWLKNTQIDLPEHPWAQYR